MNEPSTERFGNRVSDYVRYRPSYPAEAMEHLAATFGTGIVVADIGAGTGILTRLLLDRGYTVRAVEPNAAMRAALEADLSGRPGFSSTSGTAEETTLPSSSVDLVVAAQAFHWFDPDRARVELGRILRGPRGVALLWNAFLEPGTPADQAYEAVLQRYGRDYQEVRYQAKRDNIACFFGSSRYELALFPNFQHLDLDGLVGRVTSASYMPTRDDPVFPAMLEAIAAMFNRHSVEGRFTLGYHTQIYAGRL